MLQHIEDFRKFYNKRIYPELVKLERRRISFVIWLSISIILLIAITVLVINAHVPALVMFLLIPISGYIALILYRIQVFRSKFKPNIVNLILEFIEGDYLYLPKGGINREQFLNSRIFITAAQKYKAEDYIKGKIGEIQFEMCELNVRELSQVRNRFNYVFRGIFFHAKFHKEIQRTILILPNEYKQYLSKSIKTITQFGGNTYDLKIPGFSEHFTTYSILAQDVNILSPYFLKAIGEYRRRSGKELYLSFRANDIYIAVTNPKDILEPNFFRSNKSFHFVKEFYDDIYNLMKIIEDLDVTN